MKYFVIFLIVSFSQLSFSIMHRRELSEKVNISLGIEANFTEQLVDHFNLTRTDKFNQRYWFNDTYYDHDKGPAILHLCGESMCGGINPNRMFSFNLTQTFKGVIFVLEHRFYGYSKPFGENSNKIENLKYLTVDQVLSDIANFILFCKKQSIAGIKLDTPWIIIGGSYAGAISAWFRYKFPHLVIGSLASSAVINSIYDFPEFDLQIYNSTVKSGDWCPQSIQNLTRLAEESLKSDPNTFKKKFKGADKLNNSEFLFYFADMFVLLVQYSNRTGLCDMLKSKTTEQQMETMATFANEKMSCEEYGAYYVSNDTYVPEKSYRQWYYQCCSELGWMQTANAKNPELSMRSQNVTIEFYDLYCQEGYGEQIQAPDTNRANLNFGGVKIAGSNIIFTNGIDDPWKWASLRSTKNQNVTIIEIDCVNCGHCIDLRTQDEKDPETLKNARKNITDTMTQWLKDYYTPKNLIEFEL